jgi:protease-4
MLATEELDDGAAPTDAFAAIGGRPAEELAAAIADLRSVLTGPRIQVRCLECGPVAPARVTQADRGFLASLAEWF